MKKTAIIFFVLLSSILYSQTGFVCNAIADQQILAYRPEISNSSNITIDPNKKYVINVFFHIMNNGLGQNNSPLPNHVYGINDVMKAVRFLNTSFNQHNIYFKYIGFEIVNDNFYTLNPFSYPYTLDNPEAFNIFIANSGECGTACAFVGNKRSVFSFSAFEDDQAKSIFAHEIGHNLNLLHAFENFNNSNCEHVTRDENNPNYNANVAGDKVVDTPAQSPMLPADFNSCSYIFNVNRKDCQNTPYENIDRSNYMGMNFVQQTYCEHFTPGQVLRMKQYLENPLYPEYSLAYNDVSSLYEPYNEVLVPGNTIVSSEESPDGGGVLVCRNYIFKRSYQEGFSYDFYDTELTNHIYVNPYTLFTYDDRPDHCINVVINQVNPNVAVPSSTISTLLPYSCYLEPYVSGTIYSMEVLGSMNMTVQQLSEIQVKDPEKYEFLMTQYYNVLRKMTESGIIKEKVVYKN